MDDIKISVILPIYNVEHFIEITLESLLNQTFIENIEVIMVDDGSTDDSRYIIEKYALDYDNFFAYHKHNEGSGIARNFGLDLAKGTYIHFLDPDDYIPHDFYEKMYGLAIKSDVDFVVGNAYRFGKYYIRDSILFEHSFEHLNSGDIVKTNIRDTPSLLWDFIIWNKLYKRDFLEKNNIRFPNENIFSQDIIFSLKSHVMAESVLMAYDIFYYWRFRKDRSSVTQSRHNIRILNNRIRVLNLSEEFGQNMLSDDLKDLMHFRWITHDLILFLRICSFYSKKDFGEAVKDIKKILELIPNELFNDLNSFKRICYEMILNDDLDSLYSFSPLEKSLKANPEIHESLDEKYHKFIDFKRDCLDEKLIVFAENVNHDDENLIIEFSEKINYFSNDDNHYTINAVLVDNDEVEYPLKINELEKTLVVPLSLINKDNLYYIRFTLDAGFVKKEAHLRSRIRKSIVFDAFDLDLNIGINRKCIIKIRETNDNVIRVEDISLEEDIFRFSGKIYEKIDNIVMENVITLERYEYPINYISLEDDSHFKYEIEFTIPYNDIINAVNRKWEIKSDSLFKKIMLSHKFVFYFKYNKIKFIKRRNKILISDDLFYVENDISNLENKIKNLKNSNKKLDNEYNKLVEENLNLKNNLDEFKSRKVVKFVDFFK